MSDAPCDRPCERAVDPAALPRGARSLIRFAERYGWTVEWATEGWGYKLHTLNRDPTVNKRGEVVDPRSPEPTSGNGLSLVSTSGDSKVRVWYREGRFAGAWKITLAPQGVWKMSDLRKLADAKEFISEH